MITEAHFLKKTPFYYENWTKSTIFTSANEEGLKKVPPINLTKDSFLTTQVERFLPIHIGFWEVLK